MACLGLSDIIEPTSFAQYMLNDSTEKTAFVESGVIVRSPLLDEKANAGRINHLPFWNDIDSTNAPNISTSNPASDSTPDAIDAGEQVSRTAYLNQSWCEADLAVEIAGDDPAATIGNRVNAYWARQRQRRLIASLKGVLADNVANDSGDMIFDDGLATFSRDAFIDAIATMGDAFDGIQGMAVHSAIYFKMLKNDDIDFIPDSQGSIRLPTFNGVRLVVDDLMPVDTGVYTSILFGAGAIGLGVGQPKTPVAVDRKEEAGDGGGIETLYTRNNYIIHPFGTAFESASVASESPTIAELETATNWNRVIDRKNIPIAFLDTLAT